LRRHDAQVMLSQLRAAPLLHGYRGLPSASFEPLKDLLMRIGRLKDDLPAVVDVELTPIIAGSDTTDVLGARIRIVPSPGERDRLARTAS
ncbi:MAG: GNAT family N-acetyltransferase, partial [Corynebacterium sp.]|nr:GNAT family N-acetyltransferase [Corynebacterium sp.]